VAVVNLHAGLQKPSYATGSELTVHETLAVHSIPRAFALFSSLNIKLLYIFLKTLSILTLIIRLINALATDLESTITDTLITLKHRYVAFIKDHIRCSVPNYVFGLSSYLTENTVSITRDSERTTLSSASSGTLNQSQSASITKKNQTDVSDE
jgi:hypothetical protein